MSVDVMAAGDYGRYFRREQKVKIGINMADSKFLDVSCTIHLIDGDQLTLDMCGTEPVGELAVVPGADVLVTTWTGWSLCRCSAVLTQKVRGHRLFLRLTGAVIEKQTREYFRLDVSIPLCYSIPKKQLLPDVHTAWAETRGAVMKLPSPSLAPYDDAFKVTGWNGMREILPQRMNLSGGGLRFKTPEYIRPETLVAIDLFLPLIPPRVIHAVAETLRCNEIVLGREKGTHYTTAMRFHFINEKDRETIIAFIFAEQRRILSAGKRF